MSSLEQLREVMQASLEPLREQLAQVEQEIEQKELELRQLRQARTDARRLIGVLDPEAPLPGRTLKPKAGKPKTLNASQQKVDQVAAAIREHANGEVFSAGTLLPHVKGQMSKPTLSVALAMLLDRGLTRLDHVGNGGSKFYRTTRAFDES